MPTDNISSLAQRRAAIIHTDAQALEAARALAEDFAREASQRDRERRLPLPELERYSLSGLWGITVPREHGGAGVSRVTLAEVTAIISAADGSLGQIPQNHYYALEVLRVNGNADQQRRFYARALAGERAGIEAALLVRVAVHAQHFQRVVVVLRNLAKRTVGCRDDGRDFRQRHARHAGAAMLARHRDAPQAGQRIALQLRQGQPAFAIALGRFAREVLGQGARGFQRLGVGVDDGGAALRQGRDVVGGHGLRSRNVGWGAGR